MTFAITHTLVNEDSKIRLDVESIARITLSDIEYILATINKQTDTRHKRFILEAAVSKAAAVFQLAMRACDYLEKKEHKQEIIAKTKKGAGSHLGIIAKLREDNFHSGQGVISSKKYYQFANIKGCGFVGVYVHRGATLTITGVYKFDADSCEYAITSEGIFQINDAGTESESWKQMDILLNVENVDIHTVISSIEGAVKELKCIWKELREIRIRGDGVNEYKYLNEGGELELLQKANHMINTYQMSFQLKVCGELTITPPDGIAVQRNQLSYYIE